LYQLQPTTLHTDPLLIVRFLEGDQAAFDTLYNRYYQAVYNNAYTILKDAPAAEDILQETFISLWQKRSTLRNPENVGGWLFVTATNKSTGRSIT